MPRSLKDTVQRMIDAGESEANIATVIKAATAPGTYESGARNPADLGLHSMARRGFVEGVLGGATGFIKGAAKKVARAPLDIASGAIQTLTTDPRETIRGLTQAIPRIPGQIVAAAKTAGADPEGWGEKVGDVTAGTGLTIAGARIAPKVPSASVRRGVRLQQLADEMGAAQNIVPFGTGTLAIIRAALKPGLRMVGKGLEKGGRLFGGKLPFHQRPLYAQMEDLPVTEAPIRTRGAGPPSRRSLDIEAPEELSGVGEQLLTSTKSRRGTAIELTARDIEHIPEDIQVKIMRERYKRQGLYKTDAEIRKRLKHLMENE